MTCKGSEMAEREGFEPPWRLLAKTLSRRPRYDHFGTSPCGGVSATTPYCWRVKNPALTLCCVAGLRTPPYDAAPGEVKNPALQRPPTLKKPLDKRAALVVEYAAGRCHSVIQARMLVGLHR